MGLVLVETRFRILRTLEISAKLEFLERNSRIERVTRWVVWQSRLLAVLVLRQSHRVTQFQDSRQYRPGLSFQESRRSKHCRLNLAF